MSLLVDLVNFNADASCLEADRWLAALAGGEGSEFASWLQGFVRLRKKVTLGLMGAVVADLRAFNPEALDLIRRHPEIFEIILRPFSHDVALLRTPAGFRTNLALGRQVLEREFGTLTPVFLPPEFMLTSEQVGILRRDGVEAVFINPRRFPPDVAGAIPAQPYLIEGLFEERMSCVPIRDDLTDAYLDALHTWSAAGWRRCLAQPRGEVAYSWRDGESWLFVPRGTEREHHFLAGEGGSVERRFVREVLEQPREVSAPAGTKLPVYPVHSFSDWFKEFRMVGFIRRLQDLEQRLSAFSLDETVLWLQAANSDILSAVEKVSPRVRIIVEPSGAAPAAEHTIHRSARWFEGEEILAILEQYRTSDEARRYLETSRKPYLAKLRARMSYCRQEGLVP